MFTYGWHRILHLLFSFGEAIQLDCSGVEMMAIDRVVLQSVVLQSNIVESALPSIGYTPSRISLYRMILNHHRPAFTIISSTTITHEAAAKSGKRCSVQTTLKPSRVSVSVVCIERGPGQALGKSQSTLKFRD